MVVVPKPLKLFFDLVDTSSRYSGGGGAGDDSVLGDERLGGESRSSIDVSEGVNVLLGLGNAEGGVLVLEELLVGGVRVAIHLAEGAGGVERVMSLGRLPGVFAVDTGLATRAHPVLVEGPGGALDFVLVRRVATTTVAAVDEIRIVGGAPVHCVAEAVAAVALAEDRAGVETAGLALCPEHP
jgi:hypothetical protein